MEKTITVQGGGKVRVKPDLVELTLQIEGNDKNYEKAAMLASEQIEKLSSALSALGFGEDELKTTGFNVRTQYESVRDPGGEYREQFAGYVCAHSLKLSFDFSPERLSKTLSAIASSGSAPQLHIFFTAKDPEKISAALLRAAAKNAREKAKTLAKASGAALGWFFVVLGGLAVAAAYLSGKGEEKGCDCLGLGHPFPGHLPVGTDGRGIVIFVKIRVVGRRKAYQRLIQNGYIHVFVRQVGDIQLSQRLVALPDELQKPFFSHVRSSSFVWRSCEVRLTAG